MSQRSPQFLYWVTFNVRQFVPQITNLTLQNFPALVLSGIPHPSRVYQYDSIPFLDITGLTGFSSPTWSLRDSAIIDFNGDLLTDFYLAQIYVKSSAIQIDSTSIRTGTFTNGDEKGITFSSTGNVEFDIRAYNRIDTLDTNDIYIGSGGYHPADNIFTLSSEDPNVMGIFTHTPGVDFGTFLGYDTTTELWQLYVSSSLYTAAYASINADASISQLTTVGFVSSNGETEDQLLIQTAAGLPLQDFTVAAGLDIPTACFSVVAADFDNDMDVDIYLVCRSSISNLPNILYENLGSGTFQAVPGAGGAEGSVYGFGESVTTADYDEDCFMDLFVTNGRAEYSLPFGLGPHQLFRNLGNSNHCLEVDLNGVVSNRDGIGARLLATAGGITQLREQDGGTHHYSQNNRRIHFGLGVYTAVDQLTIQWPSGIIQEIENIIADQVFRAVELDITASQTSGTTPLIVNFTSNSSGYYQPISYEWDFDNDGTIDSTVQNPSYTYNDSGIFTVKLKITDFDGSIYTSIRENYIEAACIGHSVKIMGTSEYYSTLQAAYDAAVNGDTIQSRTLLFTEDLGIDRNISVTLAGGYNCDFSATTGVTTLNGNTTVSDGTITIENFIL